MILTQKKIPITMSFSVGSKVVHSLADSLLSLKKWGVGSPSNVAGAGTTS